MTSGVMKMKFNLNAFLFIVLVSISIYCVYLALISYQRPGFMLVYLGFALVFGSGAYHFRKKMDPFKAPTIEKKDRVRKRN